MQMYCIEMGLVVIALNDRHKEHSTVLFTTDSPGASSGDVTFARDSDIHGHGHQQQIAS
jgi:hypothetical protein